MVVISHVLYSKMEQFIRVLVLISAIITCIVACDDSNYDVVKLCDPANIQCVRDFFSKNGRCSVVSEPKKKVTYEIHRPLFVPSLNITAVAQKSIITNFHGIVQNLHMDKKAGNLVMAVKFEDLSIFAPDMIIAVSQEGNEPRVIRDDMNATYPVILTAVIPASNGITKDSLKNSNYFAYFPYNNATLTSGSSFAQSTDPAIKAAYEAFRADVPTTLQELFQTEASFEFLVYLQNCICDFGLSPVLKESVTITAVIPIIEGISAEYIKKAYISAYISQSSQFQLGHNFTKSNDPQMIEILNDVASVPVTISKEILNTEKVNFFLAFLQKFICDFGLSITNSY